MKDIISYKMLANIFSKSTLKNNFYKFTLVAELLIVFIVFQFLTGGTFMTTRNLSNLLMQGTYFSIISITMMMVIVSQNADLSAGMALGFMCTVAASLQVYAKLGTGTSILIVLAVGVLIGLWHGFWIGYKKLPAFIVTLASQLIFRGLTLLIGEGKTIGPVNPSFALVGRGYLPGLFVQSEYFNDTSLLITLLVIIAFIISSVVNRYIKMKRGFDVSSNKFFILKTLAIVIAIFLIGSIMIFHRGFSYAVILLLVLGAVFAFIIKNTSFGRYVFAIGGNSEAARLSGINIEFNVLLIYILHSVVTAIAAIVFLGRVGQATATAGTSFEFTAITGCVVGGTSILGGRGNIVGAIIGTMLMSALDNGMSLLNLGTTYQYMTKGLVLMLAIAMDVLSKSNKN
jgi:D-xylose transport system permease protein